MIKEYSNIGTHEFIHLFYCGRVGSSHHLTITNIFEMNTIATNTVCT